MAKAARFRTASLPRQPGELARLKVVQGPDAGSVFVLSATPASVGRGDECDLVIADVRASRRHAELRSGPTGWELVDLGSANGIFVNGKPGRHARLKSGDTLTVGDTVFEFASADAGTRVLAAPPRSAAEIRAANSALEARRRQVQALGEFGPLQLPGPAHAAASGGARNLRPLLIIGVGAALYFGIGDPGSPSGGKPAAKRPVSRTAASAPGNLAPVDLAAMLPDGPRSPAAETFFRTGFREYRERNYLRAKTAFENVLMISPGHRLAQLYRDNCDKAIADEVKFHLAAAGRDRKAGRLKSARAHFLAVLRLLAYDRSNASFAAAQEELEKVERQIRGEAVVETARAPARESGAGGGP
jgi:hypothetical protein